MSDTDNRQAPIPIALIVTAGLGAILVVAMYWQVGGYFWRRWISEDTYHHCLFVPAIVGWLIWRRREDLRELDPEPSWWGLSLVLFAALMYVVAMRIGVRVAIGFSFPLLIMGLCWTALGSRYTRAIAYPLVLLIFLIPVPKHILGHLGMPLQVWSAEGAARGAKLLGLPVIHDGINLTLNGHTYVVAEACSGLNSLLALLLAAAVLVDIMSVRWQARLVLLAIPAIVLVANTVRLISVLFFAEFAGPDFAMDSLVHGGSDVIIYLVALVFTWALLDLFSERRLLAIILGHDEPGYSDDPHPPGADTSPPDASQADEAAAVAKTECSDLGNPTLEGLSE